MIFQRFLVSPVGLFFLKIAAIVSSIAAIFVVVRESGKASERNKNLKEAVEFDDKVKRVKNEILIDKTRKKKIRKKYDKGPPL